MDVINLNFFHPLFCKKKEGKLRLSTLILDVKISMPHAEMIMAYGVAWWTQQATKKISR